MEIIIKGFDPETGQEFNYNYHPSAGKIFSTAKEVFDALIERGDVVEFIEMRFI